MLKIISLTSLGLLISINSLYAGTMGPVCVPESSTIPCESNAWDFGVYALYLNPVYGANLSYLGAAQCGLTSTWIADDPDWDWGYKIEGSYHFGKGKDLNINWYHFDQTTNKAIYINTPPADLAIPVTYKVNPKWDAVNFEIGQLVNYGENKRIRYFGGVQYTRLDHDISINFSPDIAAQGNIQYRSAGPRLGMDFNYDIIGGFSLYANAAATMLLGEGKFDQTSYFNNTVVGINRGSKDVVVPEFEGKVGARYNYPLASSLLSIDAGYMVVDFRAPIHAVSPGGFIRECDFSLSGVYFGAKWIGNI